MDVATFRTDFPEFASPDTYPDATISRYLTLSAQFLNTRLWGELLDYGTELFIAFHLTRWRKRQVASMIPGGTPGAVDGLATSKSVDRASIAKDVTLVTYKDAGFWNENAYGVEFYGLSINIGRAIQL